MLAEKPPKLVAVVLANRTARIIWALSVREEACRAPAAAGVVAKQLPGMEWGCLERKRNTGLCGHASESVMRG